MRDDLHKSAPVPHAWRQLVRSCQRDADWQSKAPRAAERAVLSDLSAEVNFGDLARCIGADSRQLPLISVPIRLPVGQGLQQRACEYIERLGRERGQVNYGVVADGIVKASEERIENMLRACDGYFACKLRPHERRTMTQRVRESLATVAVVDHVQNGLATGKVAPHRRTSSVLDIDADLRGPQ